MLQIIEKETDLSEKELNLINDRGLLVLILKQQA